MAIRKADAVWSGSLREGAGELAVESGAFRGPYTFKSRFEQGKETNPEELVAAAHAGCFTMAMTALLAREKLAPTEIRTTAAVHIEQGASGFSIPRMIVHSVRPTGEWNTYTWGKTSLSDLAATR